MVFSLKTKNPSYKPKKMCCHALKAPKCISKRPYSQWAIPPNGDPAAKVNMLGINHFVLSRQGWHKTKSRALAAVWSYSTVEATLSSAVFHKTVDSKYGVLSYF